jgi:hypothetical protein
MVVVTKREHAPQKWGDLVVEKDVVVVLVKVVVVVGR